MRVSLFLAVALVLVPSLAQATISFTQIDGDVFTVSHRVKIIGSRGKATKMVFTKAASLCIAAGFTHYEIQRQESEAAQKDDAANASLRVQFFFEDGEDRIDCQSNADPQYVAEARQKLAKRGYEPPEPSPDVTMASNSSTPDAASDLGSCTLEQIAAMARAGLSDGKIRAACAEGG